MHSISLAQALVAGFCLQQAQLSALLDAVERGEAVEITRRGAAVARLVRAPREPSDGLNLSSFLAATTDRPLQGWQRFQELRQQRLQVLTLDATDFDAAARLSLTGSAALRAGDALHLAVCQRHRSTLVSFDQVLCAAAAQHRLEVALLRIEA